jgi:manganese oxidase
MRVDVRLGATDGWVETPDGRNHYIFGFVNLTGVHENDIVNFRNKAQLVAPPLVFQVGQEVYLTLTNLGTPVRPDLDDPHTIHYHGFPNQISIYDGVPELSIAIPVGRDFTFHYKPLDPGTYMYHCHFEPVEHIHMGMVGPLVIRPEDYNSADPAYKTAYGHGTGTDFDREYFIFLTELDCAVHNLIATVQEPDWTEYKPTYWLLNGRSYPDTVLTAPGGRLQHQPYSALLRANAGEKVLLRFINLGFQQHAMELLGAHLKVIGLDAMRPIGQNGEDLAFNKSVINIAPGQTMDAIFTAPQAPGMYPLSLPLFNRNYHKNTVGGAGLGGMVTEVQVFAPGILTPQAEPNQP